MTRANALVIAVFTSERSPPKTRLSAICQQLRAAASRCHTRSRDWFVMYPPFVLDAATFEPPDDLDLVIFPDYVEGDIGIYRADLIPIKKQLAEIGVRADFAFPPDRRTWLRELSAEQLLLNIAIGLGTSGTVAMVQHLLTRQKDPGKVRVKITKARKVRGRRMWDAEFVEFEGSRDDVSAQLDQWKHLNGDE